MYDSDQQRTLYFSDNLVVVEPIELSRAGSPHAEMFSQLLSAAAYQLNLAIRGRFLRGGIAVELAYADSTFVTGPAHVQAVELEEKRAGNPRVLLNGIAVAVAMSGILTLNPDESMYENYLLVDKDGYVFLNYLMAIFEDEGFDNSPSAESGLIKHKVALESQMRKFSSGNIFRKYRWAADYHNYFVSTTRFEGRSDLVIGSGMVGSFRKFDKGVEINSELQTDLLSDLLSSE